MAEIPTRWPLASTLSNREGDFFRDARLINCFAELQPETRQFSIERRPGVVTAREFNVPNGSSQGLFNFDQSLIQLSNNRVYRDGLFLGTVGTVPGTAGTYAAAFTSADADLMMLNYIDQGYYIQSFVLTTITDSNYPSTTTPGVAYLNGRFYVMEFNGRIHGSTNLDDPSAWDPLNVIVAQIIAGQGVYLAQQLSYLCALKTNSCEIFWDSGQTATQDGSGSTLQPIPGATIPYGCQDPGTVAEIDGTLLWVTTNFSGSPQLGRLDNLQFQIISTPPVERLLRTVNYGSTIGFTLKLNGHRFYVLQIHPVGKSEFTLVYEIDQNLWYNWTSSTGASWPYYNSAAIDTGTPIVYVQGTDGQVHKLQEDYLTPTDLGVAIPLDIYTPNYDADLDREKYLTALYFNTDIVPGSTAYVRYSDDDYTTWTNPITLDFSEIKPMITDLGSFYRRAFHIRHIAPTRLRLKSLGMQMDVGTL